MKKILIFPLILTFFLSPSTFLAAQEQRSVRDLAPHYGIRPEFLDDTNVFIKYLEELSADDRSGGTGGTNHALTDTCVAINARLASFNLALQHEYRRHGDTLWLTSTTYATDYRLYARNIALLSTIALRRAYSYIQRETATADSLNQTALYQRLDSIRRNHNIIVSTCDGIGVHDKVRQKELKDIYYAYLSVYNRYDFSRTQTTDEQKMQALADFQGFQGDLIHDLLSPDNIPAQINNFANVLRSRCGRNHLEVLRSYQRVARHISIPIDFSSVYDYYGYIERLLDTRNWQQAYLTAVDLRERMDSNSQRIILLYSQKKTTVGNSFRKASDTYRDVEATISTIPTFSNSEDAATFLSNFNIFVNVIQQGYINDFSKLNAIYSHGDSIIRVSSLRYSDIAKAYRRLADTYVIVPTYRTIDEALRHAESLSTFQTLQRQFDTILTLRRQIDAARDTIADNWASHIIIYNGYQNIRKQLDMIPTFINTEGGTQYIRKLYKHRESQRQCIEAINKQLIYQGLDGQIDALSKNYRNFRKAYNTLKGKYITVKTIITVEDLILYLNQHSEFAPIQQAFIAALRGNDVAAIDARLKGITDPRRIHLILGLPD